jgi:hypothetical protein
MSNTQIQPRFKVGDEVKYGFKRFTITRTKCLKDKFFLF